MRDRRPVIGGNWKMNLGRDGAVDLARAVSGGASGCADAADLILYPPYPWLLPVHAALQASPTIIMGAQDVSSEPDGAFTGEVSASMIKECGARAVLTGHSERRHVNGESDALVRRKTHAALAAGLAVTLCVGETLAQRDAGRTLDVTLNQVRDALLGLSGSDLHRVNVAYEPVWAIGTGRNATPEDAQHVHGAIRSLLRDLFGPIAGGRVRIQYGGSVKPGNAAALAREPDIDGFLVGGASLIAGDFLSIIRAALGA